MNDHQNEQSTDTSFFRSFDLAEVWKETKKEFVAGDIKGKALSVAKLLGKSTWNMGLHLARNAPEAAKKIAEEKQNKQVELEALRVSFESMSNEHLMEIAKSKQDISERRVAYDILKQRKSEYEARNTKGRD